jgi:hypothetical protein
MLLSTFWKKLKTFTEKKYDFQQLIDSRCWETVPQMASWPHIICDIDKTYLETEFASLLSMAKIAYETAEKKITVRGAAEVLLAARWGNNKPFDAKAFYPRGLHFVSSSPPQLRATLEEKLFLDGLDWNTDTFKNQAYNVMKGRMDLLRQHVVYKSAAILRVIALAGDNSEFYMIGDNAESDSYIYMGVTLFVMGKLSANAYGEYLRIAGADDMTANDFVSKFATPPRAKVAGILIRNAPGYKFIKHDQLAAPIRLFDNYFQAALILMQSKLVPPSKLWELSRKFHNQHGLTRQEILASLTRVEQNLGDNDELLIEIIRVKAAFEKTQTRQEVTLTTNLILSPSTFESFNGMSEDDILNSARRWTEDISKQKHGK